MAVELKLEYSVDPDVKKITVKEITGAYTVNNLTGWGAPNIEKNSVAMVLFATYQPYDKAVINVSSTNQDDIYYYNAVALNNSTSTFCVPYSNDGWYKLTVAIVGTSTAIENVIFYDTALGKVQIRKNGVNVDLVNEDWFTLTNTDIYNSTTLSEIFLLKLIKQRNCYLEAYLKCAQCSSCRCHNEKEEYEKLNTLLQAVDYRFYSSKEYEAQRMTEILTKQFKCCK